MPKGYKLTTKEVADRIHRLAEGEYELVSEYVKDTVKVKILHKGCGNVFETRASHFFNGSRCPLHMNAKDPDEFVSEFNSLKDSDEYTLLSKYVRSNTKIKVRHDVCGNEYAVTPHMFLSGQRCPKCFGNKVKTTRQFSNEVSEITGGEFKVMGEYVNNRTKLVMLHVNCGNKFEMSPHDFLSGNRCPFCKQSKGEKLVQSILDDMGIDYTIQYVFDDLGRKNQRLPFDFFIEGLNLLIEYDGIQHFKEVKYFGGRHKLIEQQRRDNLKNEYAISHNISLLRIPYYLTDDEVIKCLQEAIYARKAEQPFTK